MFSEADLAFKYYKFEDWRGIEYSYLNMLIINLLDLKDYINDFSKYVKIINNTGKIRSIGILKLKIDRVLDTCKKIYRVIRDFERSKNYRFIYYDPVYVYAILGPWYEVKEVYDFKVYIFNFTSDNFIDHILRRKSIDLSGKDIELNQSELKRLNNIVKRWKNIYGKLIRDTYIYYPKSMKYFDYAVKLSNFCYELEHTAIDRDFVKYVYSRKVKSFLYMYGKEIGEKFYKILDPLKLKYNHDTQIEKFKDLCIDLFFVEISIYKFMKEVIKCLK